MSYEDYLREVNEMIEDLKGSGINPLEVHNRFALMYLERMELPPPTKDASHIIEAQEGRSSYQQCKLVVGTILMGMTQNKEAASPELSSLQEIAKDKGWVLRHYDPRTIERDRCIDIVGKAFRTTIGHFPRVCDIRICLQMGSPELWEKAKADDFVLSHNAEKETSRVSSFPEKIAVAEVAFAHELIKYIEEHMKFELANHDRKMLRALIRASLQ
jgi:hypothetical protein